MALGEDEEASIGGVSDLQDASEVVEGGPPCGEAIVYVLEKFRQHDPLLVRKLGFASGEACRFLRWKFERVASVVAGFQPEMARFRLYGRHPHKYAGEILLPPQVFSELLAESLILSSGDLNKLPGIGLNPAVPRFLAAAREELARPIPSFTRWSFLKRRDGGVQLLVPGILDREFPSALHWGLIECLDSRERGEYGNAIGKSFEEVLALRLQRYWPEVNVRRNVRLDAQSPEIDLLLELPSGDLVPVQCKTRPVSPRGRWGQSKEFLAELEQTIFRATHQARACQEVFGAVRVIANLIVLEAYFPAISLQTVLPGTIGLKLRGLARPLAINFFDLNYLLAKIPSSDFKGYLDWREERLRVQSTIPVDEFDMVRAYLVRHDARWDIAEQKGIHVVFLGSDASYDKDFLRQADSLLQYDGKMDLLLNPPPKYLRALREKGRDAADSLIPAMHERSFNLNSARS
jgi:hypothetical protein